MLQKDYSVSPTRDLGCGQRTQALLESIPQYAAQANRSAGRDSPAVPTPAASERPPEAAGTLDDPLFIPEFLRRGRERRRNV